MSSSFKSTQQLGQLPLRVIPNVNVNQEDSDTTPDEESDDDKNPEEQKHEEDSMEKHIVSEQKKKNDIMLGKLSQIVDKIKFQEIMQNLN